MRITVSQLKRIIRETIDEVAGSSSDLSAMSDEELWRSWKDEGNRDAWNELMARGQRGGSSSAGGRGRNPLQPTRNGTSYDGRGRFHGADFGRDWS
jgi:hypothetical protein